jgi:hypothetical protein
MHWTRLVRPTLPALPTLGCGQRRMSVQRRASPNPGTHTLVLSTTYASSTIPRGDRACRELAHRQKISLHREGQSGRLSLPPDGLISLRPSPRSLRSRLDLPRSRPTLPIVSPDALDHAQWLAPWPSHILPVWFSKQTIYGFYVFSPSFYIFVHFERTVPHTHTASSRPSFLRFITAHSVHIGGGRIGLASLALYYVASNKCRFFLKKSVEAMRKIA